MHPPRVYIQLRFWQKVMRIIGWLGMLVSFGPIYMFLTRSTPSPDDPTMNFLGLSTTAGALLVSVFWGLACINIIIISVSLLVGAGLVQVLIDIQDNTYHV